MPCRFATVVPGSPLAPVLYYHLLFREKRRKTWPPVPSGFACQNLAVALQSGSFDFRTGTTVPTFTRDV
jgi:hypothetical protein